MTAHILHLKPLGSGNSAKEQIPVRRLEYHLPQIMETLVFSVTQKYAKQYLLSH